MNSDEKIIEMLLGLQEQMNNMENKFDKFADKTIADIEELKGNMVGVKGDIEELKENSEITRAAANKLLDWAERVEKSASINSTISIPPLELVD